MKELKKQISIFLGICLGICFLYGIFYLDAYMGTEFHEESFTEYAQSLMLFFCGALYAMNIKKQPRYRGALILLAGAFFAMFIREQDKYIDLLLWHGAWAVPAGLVIGAAFYLALKDGREKLVGQLAEFSAWRYFPMISIGLASLLVYSRLFGSKFVWKILLANNRSVYYLSKSAIEESTELFAYTLLLASAIIFISKLQ